MTELLRLRGPDAAQQLDSSLAKVRQALSYLRAATGTSEASGLFELAKDGWFRAERVIDDPAQLDAQLRSSAAALGTGDLVVAASLWVQGYAYRLLALAVACLCLDGTVPDSGPGRLAVGSSRGRPALLVYGDPVVVRLAGGREVAGSLADPAVADAALGFLIETAVHDHLGPLVSAVHAGVKVGERLLWGNVAASAAAAFRTLEGTLGSWVVPLGERFFELAPTELHGLGSYLLVEGEGRRGWFWERTNCCLYDRLEGKIRCSDCSRTPAAERRAAYAESLRA